MEFILKINQDENFEFFQKFDTLSPLRKKIWCKIVWCVQKWPNAYPKQSKIAEWCDCSRSAVSEAFRLFKKWDWLKLQSRGWKRSKTLHIPISKQQIDTVERQYFRRVEATYRATHTYSSYKKRTSLTGPCIEIPFYLKRLRISEDSKLKLSLVSEAIYQNALESCKSDAKKGKTFQNEEHYLVGVALNMAKKQQLKLDWPSYYRSRNV